MGHGAAPCTDGACSRARLPAGESGKSLARRVWRRIRFRRAAPAQLAGGQPLERVGHGARGRVLGHRAREVLARAVGVTGLRPRAGCVDERLSGARVRRVCVGELLEGPCAGKPCLGPGPLECRLRVGRGRLPAERGERRRRRLLDGRVRGDRRSRRALPAFGAALPAGSRRTTFRWPGTTSAPSRAATVAGAATAGTADRSAVVAGPARPELGRQPERSHGRPGRPSRRSGSPSTRPASPGRRFPAGGCGPRRGATETSAWTWPPPVAHPDRRRRAAAAALAGM